ncbi:MAG: Probable transmembrane protein [uncultured Caballeronia sp.]|nr:MAG: Probable transmembrane protein [uncultured Caballeronia sp.]
MQLARAIISYIFTTLNEVFVKKSYIRAAVLCASLGLTATAFAQNGPGDQGGPQQRPGGPAMQGHNGGGYQDQNHNNGRPPMPMHVDNGPARRGPGCPRSEGPHDWHRGDRLPNDYRDRQYVVDDYRGYGLHQPPRGYHWVGVNGDYVLAAIATGVIAQIVLSNGH